MANRFTIAPCRINDSFNLTQIHNCSVVFGANNDVVVPGGAIDPGAVIMPYAEQMVNVSTHDLATALASIDVSSGLSCTAGASFYFRRRADAGTFVSGSNNQRVASSVGFIKVGGISASQDGPADLSLNYYAFSTDGYTQALAFTDSVALATSPAYVAKFYMGRAKLGSSFIDGVVGINFDAGIRFQYHPEDGCVYRKNGSIYMREPTITINLANIRALSNFSPDLAIDSASNLSVWFWKGSSGSHRVAADTAEHVKITFSTSAWSPTEASGAGSEDASIAVRAVCIGTPTVSVAATIA